jgi:hypothetical protein
MFTDIQSERIESDQLFDVALVGSLSGNRSFELLAVLTYLRRSPISRHIGRIVYCCWTDDDISLAEAVCHTFDVTLMPAPPPRRDSRGYPERQMLAFAQAVTRLPGDRWILKVRTDYNIGLPGFERVLKGNPQDLLESSLRRDRFSVFEHGIFVERASVLIPGRVQDINLIGQKRDLLRLCHGGGLLSDHFTGRYYGPEYMWFGAALIPMVPGLVELAASTHLRDVAAIVTKEFTSQGSKDFQHWPWIYMVSALSLSNLVIVGKEGPPENLASDIECIMGRASPGWWPKEAQHNDIRLRSQFLMTHVNERAARELGLHVHNNDGFEVIWSTYIAKLLKQVRATKTDSPRTDVVSDQFKPQLASSEWINEVADILQPLVIGGKTTLRARTEAFLSFDKVPDSDVDLLLHHFPILRDTFR